MMLGFWCLHMFETYLCSPLKRTVAVNIRNVLLGMTLQCTWLKEIAMFWLPDQESVSIMPA